MSSGDGVDTAREPRRGQKRMPRAYHEANRATATRTGSSPASTYIAPSTASSVVARIDSRVAPPVAASPRPSRTRRPRSSVVAHRASAAPERSEEHTSELQSLAYLVCRLLLEKKK